MTTIAEIQQATADHFGLPPQVMTAKGREVFICRPRQIGMYLSCQFTKEPLKAVAFEFCRDRTTVLHALKTIHWLRRRNAYMEDHETYLGDAIDQIIAKLKEAAHA